MRRQPYQSLAQPIGTDENAPDVALSFENRQVGKPGSNCARRRKPTPVVDM
jgi:hypothetical protein